MEALDFVVAEKRGVDGQVGMAPLPANEKALTPAFEFAHGRRKANQVHSRYLCSSLN
jgi:hypothetical protein